MDIIVLCLYFDVNIDLLWGVDINSFLMTGIASYVSDAGIRRRLGVCLNREQKAMCCLIIALLLFLLLSNYLVSCSSKACIKLPLYDFSL